MHSIYLITYFNMNLTHSIILIHLTYQFRKDHSLFHIKIKFKNIARIFKISIVRAYDRSILHVYHPKNCRKTASDAQFVSCLQSKVHNFFYLLMWKNDFLLEEPLRDHDLEMPPCQRGSKINIIYI